MCKIRLPYWVGNLNQDVLVEGDFYAFLDNRFYVDSPILQTKEIHFNVVPGKVDWKCP